MVTSFKEANSATIRFRVTNDASPDDAAYAGWAKNVERRMRLERSNAGGAGQYGSAGQYDEPEIEYPNTKLAKAYLKKKEAARQLVESLASYENAYAELLTWMVCHIDVLLAVNIGDHPHAIQSDVFTKQFVTVLLVSLDSTRGTSLKPHWISVGNGMSL